MRLYRLVPIVVIAGLLAGCAATPRHETFHLNADIEKSIGYAQAVRRGDLIPVSGTVGVGATMEAQVAAAYASLDRTLRHFGATPASVVREVVYTTDIDAFKDATAARQRFYGGHLPAASWIGVQRLYSPELKVEIEITARAPH